MNLRQKYMKNRRLLQGRYRRLQKRGYTPSVKIPKIPKRITQASIRRLVKLISKTPTVRELNKKLGLTASGKIKKSTKKKIKKKAKEIFVGKKSPKKKKQTTTKKQTQRKKAPKKQEKYLPDETLAVLDNIANSLFGADTIEDLLSNMDMVIASEQYPMIHRERVADLKSILSMQYSKYLYNEDNTTIADKLQANAEQINKGIEDIKGYVFDSSEKDYQIAVEAVVELSVYLSGQQLDAFDLSRLEDLYDEYKNELGGEYYDDMPFFRTMLPETQEVSPDEFDINLII